MLQIFVVEDEHLIRQSICKMIEPFSDFEVVGECMDGQQALNMLKELTPHILMTDIQIPFMNGLQLAGEARKLLPELEIILFSGFNDFEYVREGLRQGVHDYLLKPVQPADLERVLQQVSNKLLSKKEKLPRQVVWMEAWREHAKNLAENVWLVDKEKFEREWAVVQAEWFKREKAIEDIYAFFHLIMFMLNERMSESDGSPLSDQAFHPLDFTGDSRKDAKRIQEYLAGIMNELLTQRNWRKSHIVSKALDYIEQQYKNPNLSLYEASEMIGMSHPYLSRMFKEEMGKTFVDYVADLRINKAKELLSNPDVKVYEVAGAVGYTEYASFARLFKRVAGYSPSDYRKQLGIR